MFSVPLRSSEQFRAVVFRVAGLKAALALIDVAEILPLPRLAVPPHAPPAVAGLATIGGVPVPVLKPAVLMGLPDPRDLSDLYSHLIVLAGADRAALLVDRAEDVVVVSRSGVSAVDGEETLRGTVTGIFTRGGEDVVLVSAPRLLGVHERERLADFARREAERAVAIGAGDP